MRRGSARSTGGTGAICRQSGRIGLFLSSWYSRPVLDRVYGRSRTAEFDRQLERIAGFERDSDR